MNGSTFFLLPIEFLRYPVFLTHTPQHLVLGLSRFFGRLGESLGCWPFFLVVFLLEFFYGVRVSLVCQEFLQQALLWNILGFIKRSPGVERSFAFCRHLFFYQCFGDLFHRFWCFSGDVWFCFYGFLLLETAICDGFYDFYKGFRVGFLPLLFWCFVWFGSYYPGDSLAVFLRF